MIKPSVGKIKLLWLQDPPFEPDFTTAKLRVRLMHMQE